MKKGSFKLSCSFVTVLFLGTVFMGANAQAPNDCGIPAGGNTTTGNYNVGNLGVVTGTVTNPQYASDRSTGYKTATYTAFTTTGVTLAATFNEIVYFHTTDLYDSITVTLQLPATFVSALSSLTIQAYSGSTPVGAPQSIGSVLTGLGLLNSSSPFTIGFVPMGSFDNVKIMASILVGVNLATDFLRVYDVTVCPTSAFATDNLYCSTTGSSNTTVAVQSPDSASSGISLLYSWYLDPTTTTVSGTTTNSSPALDYASAFPSLLSNGNHTVYVTTSKVPCTNDTSSRVPITINVTTCSLLPVTGLKLIGSTTDGFPMLNWITETETNSNYFLVESSADGLVFKDVNKLNAAGNSAVATYYSYEDKDAMGTMIYYRIRAVDKDGQNSYSNIVAVNMAANISFKVFPNPVSDFVNIQVASNGTYLVELFNIDGKKVHSAQITSGGGMMALDIKKAKVATGLYSIRISDIGNIANRASSTIFIK